MFKALKSFSGVVSMVKGECREIDNEKAVADLLRAGYIVELTPARAADSKEPAADDQPTEPVKTRKRKKAVQ